MEAVWKVILYKCGVGLQEADCWANLLALYENMHLANHHSRCFSLKKVGTGRRNVRWVRDWL